MQAAIFGKGTVLDRVHMTVGWSETSRNTVFAVDLLLNLSKNTREYKRAQPGEKVSGKDLGA